SVAVSKDRHGHASIPTSWSSSATTSACGTSAPTRTQWQQLSRGHERGPPARNRLQHEHRAHGARAGPSRDDGRRALPLAPPRPAAALAVRDAGGGARVRGAAGARLLAAFGGGGRAGGDRRVARAALPAEEAAQGG